MKFKKQKQHEPQALTGIAKTQLEDARDAAGFMFGAVMREQSGTVVFAVHDAAELSPDALSAWEQTIGSNETVLATEFAVGIAQATLAVTVLRNTDEDDGELLTRLATTIPEWYMPQVPVEAFPLSSLEIAAHVGQVLGSDDNAQWPMLGGEVSVEQRDAVVVGKRAFRVFDAMEDNALDTALQEWCARGYTQTSRWVRIFRPAEDMDIDAGVVGRHCGILLVTVPTDDLDTLRLVAQEVRMTLPAEHRLRLQPLWARQEAGIAAGIGIGAFAWNATPKAA